MMKLYKNIDKKLVKILILNNTFLSFQKANDQNSTISEMQN